MQRLVSPSKPLVSKPLVQSLLAPSPKPPPPPPPPSIQIPHLSAATLSCAHTTQHVDLVASHLAAQGQGLLKVTLDFADPASHYLRTLVTSLHRRHGHGLPISHSASSSSSSRGGWFWDVRPSPADHHNHNHDHNHHHRARSETTANFPWHTDCSYEDPVPRFFALHVLQHDRFRGGTLSVMSVASLARRLSPSTRLALQEPHFSFSVPREFVKRPGWDHVVGRVASTRDGHDIMRLRRDILTPLTGAAESALDELGRALACADADADADADVTDDGGAVLHFGPEHLPRGSVVLMDNSRWLHARSRVEDPERHLRRVRWDALPFGDH